MAATAEQLAALDAQYRRQQMLIAAATAVAVLRLWSAVRPGFLAIDGARWVNRSVPIVQGGHVRAAKAASVFYGVVRDLQIGAAADVPDVKPFLVPIPDVPPVAQIKTSLWVTGIVGAQQRINKIPGQQIFIDPSKPGPMPLTSFTLPDVPLADRQGAVIKAGVDARVAEAMDTAGAMAGGATVRLVGNGGRTTIKEASKADPRAFGYVRVTDGNPCDFCAMLASRTTVEAGLYRIDSFKESNALFTGDGIAKVHDSCACTMRALYGKGDAEIPAQNQHYADVWDAGDGTFEGFRKALKTDVRKAA